MLHSVEGAIWKVEPGAWYEFHTMLLYCANSPRDLVVMTGAS